MPLVPTRLDGAPPTLLFVPPEVRDAPLLLLGHGAHLSKDDPVMQVLAKTFCRGVPATVALMDCPGHGERRAPGLTDEQFEVDVRRRMRDPSSDPALVRDWSAVVEAARAAIALRNRAVGYAGFSMGAMYGLSIVADLPEVRSAVFALGGLVLDGDARNARIRDGARRLGEREVLMLNMTRDEHFPIGDAIDVLEAIPGPKRMAIYSGTHVEIPPEAITLAIDFLRRTLA